MGNGGRCKSGTVRVRRARSAAWPTTDPSRASRATARPSQALGARASQLGGSLGLVAVAQLHGLVHAS
eukprot:358593-Chlamydomonas_euryale.AAC.9